MTVLGKNDSEVKCRVTVGGVLTERRGLMVPGMRTSCPFITDALREHIAFAVQQKPDYLAVSFVSSAEDAPTWTITESSGDIDADLTGTLASGGGSRFFWIEVTIN